MNPLTALRRLAATVLCLGLAQAHGAEILKDWPSLGRPADPVLERRVAGIVGTMTLAQKIGQMTQPEIKSVTPDEVRRYYIGSVLNGGGSWPGGNKHASAKEWLSLADRYYDASMATDMKEKVPVIWGTDAIHGHSNVYGATLFPHNIGLGAARDPKLVEEIGGAVARAVRATGIQWVFAPTLAVVRDDRWGRTYESFAEDPQLVRTYAEHYVRGLQKKRFDDSSVVATAKHFIGDGGTNLGRDQGINKSTMSQMINIHGPGYYGAMAADVQTVMASFNSWHDATAGIDYGKMHGSRVLLTEVLKQKMGFDGFVVSDWNGIAQVPGCRDAGCPEAINAGIDMVMVPDDWKNFIANTMEDVQAGRIPMARIDDAVSRILRVKIRAGIFGSRPSAGAVASTVANTAAAAPSPAIPAALQARELARRAVRQSLVLLKNNGQVLPLARGRRILVVGKSADSMPNQTGGWTLTWQGTENTNADFPHGDTILAGIREAAGEGQVVYAPEAKGADVSRFDAVIAVIGETPYAEGAGDIPPSATLHHASRAPEDLAVLKAVGGKGKPVVTVFLSGRPLYVNDLINRSDAFVAAWLPGTEGKGVTDVLFRTVRGSVNHNFTGTLPFSWPKAPCQTPLNPDDKNYAPLFSFGHGLRYGQKKKLPILPEEAPQSGCVAAASAGATTIFDRVPQGQYRLFLSASVNGWQENAATSDLNATQELPAANPSIILRSSQIHTQQDAKAITWAAPAQFYLRSGQPADFRAIARAGALEFDVLIQRLPEGPVKLHMDCTYPCRGTVDITQALKETGVGNKRTIKIPLACFAARGTDLGRVDTPFNLATVAPFAAMIGNIRLTPTGGEEWHALSCAALGN